MSDVRLVVGQRADPAFWLYNPSSVVAQQPKYQLALWDLNLPDPDSREHGLNLQIPAKVMQDYILAGTALGPWRILDQSPRGREVAQGHAVFGFALVQCSNCRGIRYFWIFLKIGESGWVAEVPEDRVKTIKSSLAAVLAARDRAISVIDQMIPFSSRELVP